MNTPKFLAIFKDKNAFCSFMVMLAAALLLSFYGCGESAFEDLSSDDTFEAQIEEAKIALDDTDYTRTIEILEGMENQYPDNMEVKQYLSNAYAGLAGLDTYDLLATIAKLDEEGQNGSIDMIGTVLGDENGRLSEIEVDEKLVLLDDAIDYMQQTLATSAQADVFIATSSGDDRTVQRGILAISRIVLLMADMILDQLGITEVMMTEADIRIYYAHQDPDFDGIFNNEIALKLAEDILAIDNAISAIAKLSGSDNDLYEDFTKFMNDLDHDGNLVIDQLEIEMYLIDIRND